MDFSCSAAVPGSGSNKEYALHQLFFNKGDIKRAILCLMSKKISPSFVKFIGDYHYQDSDIWTTEEIALFTDTIMKEDKDFISITRAVSTKEIVLTSVSVFVSYTTSIPGLTFAYFVYSPVNLIF